jgi:flagellar biosynthesis/type III secretory pathway protein FliH
LRLCVDDSYYSEKLEYNKKDGYIQIDEDKNNKYFVQFVYNYSKMEAYVSKEDLVDTVQNEPYELGVEEGKKVGYDEAYEEGYNDGYQNGKDEGYNRGYRDMYDKIESRGFFGRMRSPRTLLTDDD